MSELSREQFYEWLSKHEVKILEKQSELDQLTDRLKIQLLAFDLTRARIIGGGKLLG